MGMTLCFGASGRQALAAVWVVALAHAPMVWGATATKVAPVTAAVAQAPLLRLNPGASQIAFTARQIGVPMEGRFKRFTAQVWLDPKRPETGQVQVRIDLTSATLGADGEALLQEDAWFNTAKFPQAEFVSKQIKSVGPGRLQVLGVFKLKGVSQDIAVPVTLVSSGSQLVATGSFTLPRLAYQVGNGEWADTGVIADDVQVQFSWQLQGVPPVK
jgi:polyisoprenoid-binding protein YceI